MNKLTTLRGPILNPKFDGSVEFFPDAALQWDDRGRITYVGDYAALKTDDAVNPSRGIILPPFLDCHIHIPQWPIRGLFCDGIVGDPPQGRLLAGLNRNVFPIEGKCSDEDHVKKTVAAFAADELEHGVVGGSAYMTVHAAATAAALRTLPKWWSVGLVLMNMNCPTYLRTDEQNLAADVQRLAEEFGRRMILTDRFAVAVDSPLRRRAVKLAEKFDLRMQTHLNEQSREKHLVEKDLYPDARSYSDVYRRDGLLDRQPILAHCVQMSEAEFDLVASRPAAIAHCPVSNTLLESGVMNLDRVMERRIPWALCTDVGASSTTSLLCEMLQFLKVHAGTSRFATPDEALYRTTLGAAQVLGLQDELGTFAVGRPASFIEVESHVAGSKTAHDAILHGLLDSNPQEIAAFSNRDDLDELRWITSDFQDSVDRLDKKVLRVTLGGRVVWQRERETQ